MPTTMVNMLYLGNYPDVDPIENGTTADNAVDLNGVTAANGGILKVVQMTLQDIDGIVGNIEDNDRPNGIAASADRMVYDLGAGQVTVAPDSSLVGNVRITLGDGTVLDPRQAVIIQAANGDVFVTELNNNGSLDNLGVESIQILEITATNFSGFFADQSVDNAAIVCFTTGTMIHTPDGQVPVEDLQTDDLVMTLDDGAQPVRWIGSRSLSQAELAADPKLLPVRIRAGALGNHQPAADLIVSPQHRILVSSAIAERMFGQTQVLVAAKHLLDIDGIDIADDLTQVTYWHFLFDTHQVVFSNGASTESMFTGPEALKSVSPEARAEILAIFPGLAADPADTMAPVRLMIPGRRARAMAKRIGTNRKPLVA